MITKKIILPKFGDHMKNYSDRTKARVGRRETHSAPLPYCDTDEQLAEVLAAIKEEGFLLLDMEQHLVTMDRAEKKGFVVKTEGLSDYKISTKAAAKGEPGGKIWFVKADYQFFLPSRKIMSEQDREAARASTAVARWSRL
ncbi:hypothetical protein [Armatimonas sp.]|uniref:hypothetical protein n=1 Tax=Armatimonas sp. TaxID=1872638 RepID=UPI00286BAA2F|nr:hypothetical protein [Armatimonas sp.]